ncbi:hypothetical protein D9M72_465010 [compost metagenome]
MDSARIRITDVERAAVRADCDPSAWLAGNRNLGGNRIRGGVDERHVATLVHGAEERATVRRERQAPAAPVSFDARRHGVGPGVDHLDNAGPRALVAGVLGIAAVGDVEPRTVVAEHNAEGAHGARNGGLDGAGGGVLDRDISRVHIQEMGNVDP